MLIIDPLILLNRMHFHLVPALAFLNGALLASRRTPIIRKIGILGVCAVTMKEDGVGNERGHEQHPGYKVRFKLAYR